MKLEIKNIGAIQSADISIEGLTVLAGSNGSGKTTIVKILNSCIETILYKNTITIDYVEKLYISKVIGFLATIANELGSQRQKIFFSQTRREIKKHLYQVTDGNFTTLENSLIDLFQFDTKEELSNFKQLFNNFINQELESHRIELKNYLLNYEIPAIDYINNELEGYFSKNYQPKIKLTTSIGNSSFEFFTNNEQTTFFKSNIIDGDFFESVLFYNECTLEEISEYPIGRSDKLFQKEIFLNPLKEIFQGSIDVNDGDHIFKDNYGNNFDMNFVASGINSLAPFYRMIDENKIETNSVFIIDEPETNLHPEWQVKFAEILTLLVRNGVTVVVSSHSPIFISAIEKYSVKNNIEKATSYYLAEISKTDGRSNFRDCTKDVDQLLNTLFAPFHKIVWSFDE